MVSREVHSRKQAHAGRRPALPGAIRRPLSRQRILETALRLVDAEGLGALTMRRLGAELGGFEAMSLYHHVSGKAEVLDGILEVVWSEFELPPPDLACWDRLAHLARAWRALARAHPNMLAMLANRAVHAAHALRAVEFALDALEEAGFRGQEAAWAFRMLLAYVYGQASLELLRSSSAGEGSRPERWYDLSLVPGECPHVIALAEHFRAGHDDSFEWGLQATLDGLRRRLA